MSLRGEHSKRSGECSTKQSVEIQLNPERLLRRIELPPVVRFSSQ
jgi:hypothetical protein